MEAARRRARIYGGRAGKTALGRGIAHPCLFLHLPKCGGTSLAEALYAAVPLHRRVGVIDAIATRRAAAIHAFGRDDAWLCHDDLEAGAETFDLRERLLLTHACWQTTLIHGHVLFTDRVEQHVLGDYRVVTVMRDPVRRAISNYRMALAAGIAPADVDEWLASPIGRQHATAALRYLSGRASVPEAEADSAFAVAMRRIEQFAIIGFLEDLPGFISAFAGMMGVRLSLGRANEARGPAVSLDDGQMKRLEAMCAYDIALYRRAREIFG